MAQHDHPIFDDIWDGDWAAVQQRVLADGAVLEERNFFRMTPVVHALSIYDNSAMALWLIQHGGQRAVDAADANGWTALHWASTWGPLKVVQALVAAGADPAIPERDGGVPLMHASSNGHTDIVDFLLQLPAARATIDAVSIDHINQYQRTALSRASYHGHQPIVQLLLDVGADPTLPAGQHSPLHRALSNNHHAIAALLRHPIDKAERARALHKIRSLLVAGAGAVPACMQGRVEQGQVLPQLGFARWGHSRDEKLRATVAFAVGVSGGEKDTGLCEELYVELLGYMLPGAWADKGPEVEDDGSDVSEEEEEEEEDSGSEDNEFGSWAEEED